MLTGLIGVTVCRHKLKKPFLSSTRLFARYGLNNGLSLFSATSYT